MEVKIEQLHSQRGTSHQLPSLQASAVWEDPQEPRAGTTTQTLG